MGFTRCYAWLKTIVIETSIDAVDPEKQMFGTEQIGQKEKTEVELLFNNGAELRGHLFVHQQDRLLRTLSDTRAFLPIEGDDGAVILINKSRINRIRLMDHRIKHGEVVVFHICQ